jgi:hypothetical protein
LPENVLQDQTIRYRKKRNERETPSGILIKAWYAQRRARSSINSNSGEVTPLDLLDVLERRIAEVDGKVNALPTTVLRPRQEPMPGR